MNMIIRDHFLSNFFQILKIIKDMIQVMKFMKMKVLSISI